MKIAFIVYLVFMAIGILFWLGSTAKPTPKQDKEETPQ